ncbi:MAG: hypothetical protein AAF901_04560 [Bacteroidota bacterium]
MKKEIVSTIITGNYGHFALALHDSLLAYNPSVHYAVFISNGHLETSIENEIKNRENILLVTPDDVKSNDLAVSLHEKYNETYHDAYRWGMKPLLLNHLLALGYERAIYVDSDIFFYSDYQFLFENLTECDVLLSPHWRSSDPDKDLSNFRLNFLDGIYNGGFVGVSKGGEKAMSYWAKLVLHNCEANRAEGYYVDQRYLDILPTRFEKVSHILHKGCNVANWNQVDCERVQQANGEVLINDQYPIVFIHYTNSMLRGILLQEDGVLKPYLERYRDTVLKYSSTDLIERFMEKGRHQNSRSDVGASKQKSPGMNLIKRVLKKIRS